MTTASALTYLHLADEMEQVLRRHVMEAWFPVCVNPEGGFTQDFDRRWQRGSSSDSLLEFQARQTRVAAMLAIAYPNEGRWQEYAIHGLRYLRDVMWDVRDGGWFWTTDARGRPLAGATKHSHASAYAIQSAALVFQASGERWALEHAEEGFSWLSSYAHDEQFGGLHGWLTRDGSVISSPADVPEGAGPLDPMGHDVGLKDANVLGDWFEALLDLAANSTLPRVRELLLESAQLLLSKATTINGELHYAFYNDWTPQPGLEWYGYGLQAQHRLLTAARLLPELPGLEARAWATGSHALKRARHRSGGFLYAGQGGSDPVVEGIDTRVPVKSWWVQIEAVRALVLCSAREPEPGPYSRLLFPHWRFFTENFLDQRFGGLFSAQGADRRTWRSLARRDGLAARKARPWKDASHETSSLLQSIGVLRGHS